MHARFHTPAFAIVVQAGWAAVLLLSGSYNTLYSYTMVAAWIFYTLSVAAVFVLRRKFPLYAATVQNVGLSVHPARVLAVSVWFLVNSFVTQPIPSFWALIMAGTGIPAYEPRKTNIVSGPFS